MRLEGWCRDQFGGARKTLKILAAASLMLMLAVATSRAGDLSGQPANTLSVTNSVTNVLPQAAGGGVPTGGAAATAGGGAGVTTAPSAAPGYGATPPPGGEEGWLSGLHISGYGSQTAGMWQNPPNLQAYTPSRNYLAVSRSLLQIDGNYRLNENNTFFARGWFVYEPPYAFNYKNNNNYAAKSNYIGPSRGPGFAGPTNPFCKANPSCAKTAAGGDVSYGHDTNGFYNTYELRDAWWENKTGPLTLFIGNQIVVWGQSVAFRVGDVVNPTNTCWAFGFANLEQSRIPQWMVHPILNLPEWGNFTSNFLELVVQPGFQPNWQPDQYQDPFHKYRSALTAGRANTCLPNVDHGAGGRFDAQYPTTPVFGGDFIGSPVGPYSAGGNQGSPNLPQYKALVTPEVAHEFWLCNSQNGLGGVPAFNPYKAFLTRFPHGFPCNLGLSKGNNRNGNNILNGSLVDVGYFQVPGMQPQNWNEGVRFHTLYGATEWTALYYYDSVNAGGPATIKWRPFTNLYDYQYPAINQAGVTVDRPLPAPASIAEYFPAVFRGEMIYQNHTSVDTSEFQDFNGQRWSDQTKYMLALDVDQAYAPWLTSTGNLSAGVEVEQTTVLDDCKQCWDFNAFDGRLLKNDVTVEFNLGTSWWWSDFAPTWFMLWNPKGNNMAFFPNIILNPPWTKKYFVKLQAVELLGGDKVQGLGLFKGQSQLLAQFQYNFNVM
jgi:hypothetical protein